MTPDWLVKLGLNEIRNKPHGPDVDFLLAELSARLNISRWVGRCKCGYSSDDVALFTGHKCLLDENIIYPQEEDRRQLQQLPFDPKTMIRGSNGIVYWKENDQTQKSGTLEEYFGESNKGIAGKQRTSQEEES